MNWCLCFFFLFSDLRLPQQQQQQHGGDRGVVGKPKRPEQAPLKCPRCESTNTKFCYYNNYSLSQPRHFCKACRRYWTRGGALRNVPVGGGCRRRNKRTSSKTISKFSTTGRGGGGGGAVTNNNNSRNINNLDVTHLTDYGGLGFPSIDLVNQNYQIGGGGSGGIEYLQFPQFPLFSTTTTTNTTGLDQLYQFDGTTQAGFTTAEVATGNMQYWSGNINGNVAGSSNNITAGYPSLPSSSGWMDLAGFNSTSTGNLL